MRLLYRSVHETLEYDELQLFLRLGYEVFSLGAYMQGGSGCRFRPPLDMGPSLPWLRAQFDALGCAVTASGWHLSPEWIALFDAVIVMHDVGFVIQHWSALSSRPVVLRTIGQGIELVDQAAAPYRPQGLRIVRYSPVEMLSDYYLGADAVIRFVKDPADYGPWVGGDRRILTFTSNVAERFPAEFARYSRVVAGMPTALGGYSTENLQGGLGLVSFDEQRALMRQCAAYLYCSGGAIPYTLAFLEAWISGIPVVVLDAGFQRNRFFEIPSLIQHGETGFVFSEEEEARAMLMQLVDDPELAGRIGSAGRQRATELFGTDAIAPQWHDFLTRLGA